jgi:hypothetical protein
MKNRSIEKEQIINDSQRRLLPVKFYSISYGYMMVEDHLPPVARCGLHCSREHALILEKIETDEEVIICHRTDSLLMTY